MALNEAYGQTDVTNDPRWIMANYKGKKRDLALRKLDVDEERRIKDQEFAIRNAGLEESRQQRFDMSAANRALRGDMHSESLAAHEADRARLEAATNESQAIRQAQNLQLAMHDPSLKPEEQKRMKDAYMALILNGQQTTGSAPGVGAPTKAKGEYGPGGAPAPTVASSASTYTPPTGAFQFEPPPVGPEGTAQLDRINQLKAGGQGYVEGGNVYGGPKGYDFNTNTGEYVPSSYEGTINGKPAGQALAEGSRSSGVRPIYSERGMAALGESGPKAVATSAPTTPPAAATTAPNTTASTGNGIGATLGKAALLGTVPIYGPGIAAGYLLNKAITGSSAGASGAPPAIPTLIPSTTPPNYATSGPQPNPTPEGTPTLGPFTGAAYDFQHAPLAPTPTPAGTPPAIPMVNPQAGNDRTSLLNDINDTFYGGGHAPPPTPTPTPVAKVAQNNAMADYLRRLGIA